MGLIALFAISGTALVIFLVAKSLDEKKSRQLFIFHWIKKSDERIRDCHYKCLHLYSEGKERMLFFFNKQVSLHSRNIFNKLIAFLKEKREQYETNIRNSRLLKKPDGISEFFKSISEVERGNGEINESFEDRG